MYIYVLLCVLNEDQSEHLSRANFARWNYRTVYTFSVLFFWQNLPNHITSALAVNISFSSLNHPVLTIAFSQLVSCFTTPYASQ